MVRKSSTNPCKSTKIDMVMRNDWQGVMKIMEMLHQSVHQKLAVIQAL